MLTLSGTAIGVAILVVVFLAIVARVIIRWLEDRKANRWEELRQAIDNTAILTDIGDVRRKHGVFQIPVDNGVFSGVCKFDPRTQVLNYSKAGFGATANLKGRSVETYVAIIDTFLRSLNVQQESSVQQVFVAPEAQEADASETEISPQGGQASNYGGDQPSGEYTVGEGSDETHRRAEESDQTGWPPEATVGQTRSY